MSSLTLPVEQVATVFLDAYDSNPAAGGNIDSQLQGLVQLWYIAGTNVSGLNASTFPQATTAGLWGAPAASAVQMAAGAVALTLNPPLMLAPGQFAQIYIFAYGKCLHCPFFTGPDLS